MAEETCKDAVQMCTIEASVPTGFESVAAEEAKEMFQTECRSARGKITFQIPVERVKEILQLGGIDHCRAQILHIPCFGFTSDGDDCLARLQLLVRDCNWKEGLDIWSKFYSFEHPICSQPDTIPTDEELIDICYSVHMPGHRTPGEGKKKRNRRDKRKGRKGKEDNKQKEEENRKHNDSVDCNREVASAPEQTMSDDVGSHGENKELGCDKEMEPKSVGTSSVDGCPIPNNVSEKADVKNDDQPHNQKEGAQSPVKKFKNSEDLGSKHMTDKDGNSFGQLGASLTNSAGPGDHTAASGNSAVAVPGQEAASAVEPSTTGQGGSGEMNGVEPGKTGETAASGESPSKGRKRVGDPTKPVFRVTCKRSGENHSFDSMSAAASLGSAVQTYFGWSVHMTNYNIEIMLSIDNNEVSVGLTLTPESLHKRNLVAFGVTTLRPTICHNLLRMVKIHPGHIVCDPLCGTSSISIQGALRFPAMQICGDNHNVAMEKTLMNKNALNTKRVSNGSGGLMMDAVQWNACRLPFRDGIVDVFVSDLPFGKRVGRKFDNLKLYCNVLDEMARCGKRTGRAALLTGDINNMVKAIQAQRYWIRRRCYSCNIGGISAGVFLLYRSEKPYSICNKPQISQGASKSQNRRPPPPADQNGPDLSPSANEQSGQSIANEEGQVECPEVPAAPPDEL